MTCTTLQAAVRPRGFVSVRGPDAAAYLERMLSNEIEGLDVGGSCEALLLTPKARIVATMTVLRRGADDFLLLTEPELETALRAALLRARLAARCEIETEHHRSTLVLGRSEGGVPNRDYGVAATELIDADAPPEAQPIGADELERRRIEAGTPRIGREIDDRVLPAEAGLEERSISFTKGCYPGQEPVARLHHRGHVNRSLRVVTIDGDEPVAGDAELVAAERVVGRVTSAAPAEGGGLVALAYVRREIADGTPLALADGRAVRLRASAG
jgi:folate-binding protein YgfZ